MGLGISTLRTFKMKKKYTHVGTLYGDARTGDKRPRVCLRGTILHWITPQGGKFRKTDGTGMGEWPLWSLDLSSVVELKSPLIK